MSLLDRRPALLRPEYTVAITYAKGIHHVAIEYTEISTYSRIEVRVLTHLLQGSGDGAKAVVEELRILTPILIRRRGLLKKAKIKRNKLKLKFPFVYGDSYRDNSENRAASH